MSTPGLVALGVVLPLAVATLLAALSVVLPRVVVDVVSTAAAAATVVGDAVLLHRVIGGERFAVHWAGGWKPVRGHSVGVVLVGDPMSAGLALLAAVLCLAVLVYSWRYFEDQKSLFQVLVLVFLAAMSGFALTGDLFDMFVFFELMGVVAYILTGYLPDEPGSVQGALTFGVVNSLGAAFSLFGVSLLYGRTSELGMAAVGDALARQGRDALVVCAFVLVCTGLLVKAAAVPFHFWTADAEAVAPTPVCALLSGAMVVMGVYGVARMWFTVFAGVLPAASARTMLLLLGAVTALVGGWLCFLQRHVKRLLAYSTISHVGLFLVAVGVLDVRGVAGAAAYVAGHAVVKAALFLATGGLLGRLGSVDEGALHGRGRGLWVTGAVMGLGALCLAGLPPSGTWAGKAIAEDAAAGRGLWWVPLVFLVASALTGGAVLRVSARVFLGVGDRLPPRGRAATVGAYENEEPLRSVPVTMLLPPVLLLGAGVVMGAWPGLWSWAATAANALADRQAYGSAVLGTSSAGAPPPVAVPGPWTGSAVLTGLLGVVLATSLAAGALWWSRLPASVRHPAARLRVLARAARDVHAARLGDHVAWVLAGVSVVGAVVALRIP